MSRPPLRFAAGDLVRIRSERWRVHRVVGHSDCSVLVVRGCDASNRGADTAFLIPFDIVERVGQESEAPRMVRASALASAARRVLSGVTPRYTSLRAAAAARLTLFPFQLEPAMAMTRGLACRFLLADSVGLGKTIEAGLMIAEILIREPDARALIVVPAGLREQWRDELRERFSVSSDLLDAGSVARLAASLPADVNPWSVPRVAIVSIDFVKRVEVIRALETIIWDLVILDEAHALTGRSDRTAAASALAKRARRLAIVTATPHSGDPAAFERLCRLGELAADDPLLVFRRDRSEAGWVSRRRQQRLSIRLTAAERAMHRAMQEYATAVWRRTLAIPALGVRLAMTTLARRACSSPASLVLSIRRRIAALSIARVDRIPQPGLPFDDDPSSDAAPDAGLAVPGLADVAAEREWLRRIAALATAATLAESKVAVLRRLLRRVSEPVIVFTEYRDTLEHVLGVLEHLSPAQLHGGMEPHDRMEVIRRFSRGDIQLLLATDAASEGLNLHHRCRLAINLEVPWTPLRLEQRAGRIDRLGQSRRAHALTFVARGTVEESVVAPRLLERMTVARRAAPFAIASGYSVEDLGQEAFGGGTMGRPVVDERLPHGVVRVSLEVEALEEAARLHTAARLNPRGRPSSDHAEPRPPAGVLRARSPRHPRIYWALRFLFADDTEELLWETVAGLSADIGPPSTANASRLPWLAQDPREIGGPVGSALAVLQHSLLARFRQDMEPVVTRLLQREHVIANVIRRDFARLSGTLRQPGLFDARVLRTAEAQRRLTDAALVKSLEHVARMQRGLSAPAPTVRVGFVVLVRT